MAQKTEEIKRIVSETFNVSKKNALKDLIDSLSRDNEILQEKLKQSVSYKN